MGQEARCYMQEVGSRQHIKADDRRAIVLEFIAAAVIFGLVAVVLYMIFAYRPA